MCTSETADWTMIKYTPEIFILYSVLDYNFTLYCLFFFVFVCSVLELPYPLIMSKMTSRNGQFESNKVYIFRPKCIKTSVEDKNEYIQQMRECYIIEVLLGIITRKLGEVKKISVV